MELLLRKKFLTKLIFLNYLATFSISNFFEFCLCGFSNFFQLYPILQYFQFCPISFSFIRFSSFFYFTQFYPILKFFPLFSNFIQFFYVFQFFQIYALHHTKYFGWCILCRAPYVSPAMCTVQNLFFFFKGVMSLNHYKAEQPESLFLSKLRIFSNYHITYNLFFESIYA